MNEYPPTAQEARQDIEKENHSAVVDRENHEEANFDEDHKTSEDKDVTKLAIHLALADARDTLTIKELALEITKGLYDWVGSQEDKLLELSKELADHANVPEVPTNE
jgi:hypothetical protein